jgi:hypothetical protein
MEFVKGNSVHFIALSKKQMFAFFETYNMTLVMIGYENSWEKSEE